MESLTTAKKTLHDTFYILLQSVLQSQERPLIRYSTCQKRNTNIIQHYLIKLSVYLSVCVVFFQTISSLISLKLFEGKS